MADPCATCPWRKTSTVGGHDIPRFDICKMRNLQNTVGDDDAFRPIMACHYSEDGAETPCRGYLIRHGYSNLNVRVGLMREQIEPWPDEDEWDDKLWPSFDVMLAAYNDALAEVD